MPIIPFHNSGAFGLISDLPAHELPPEAWSSCQNIRFIENAAEKFMGHTQVYGTLSGAPYWLLPVVEGEDYRWVYPTLTKVYVTDGTTHKDLTRASGGDYSATEALGWNGGVLGGIPVLNNGVDDPQMWSPVDFATPQKLTALSNWPASTIARIIRPFGSFLVALNITKSGTEYPHMVKWSHPADSGAVPDSWDETDATKDAGENTLSETAGHLVDCWPLRDINVLYKEDAIWGMQHLTSALIFKFFGISNSIGAMSRRCMKEYRGKHIVFGFDDIVVHDTQQIQSIINNKNRRWLYNQIDGDNSKLSFVTPNFQKHEFWFCFPENGEDRPTLALVWNARENTFGVRELPSISHIGWGNVDTGASDVWDDDTAVWDSDFTVWNERSFNPASGGLAATDPDVSKIFRLDDTNTFDGATFTSYLERTGLAIVGQTRTGEPRVDFDSWKFCRAIRPRMESTGPVNIYLGGQENREAPINWQGPIAFDPNTEFEAHFAVSARLFAVRFESFTDIHWKLFGFDLDLEVTSRY